MDITQHATFLQSLVKQVRQGSLMPASFQRHYVWNQDDILALIESILIGYPIGAFLVWSPYGKADLTKVGRRRLGACLRDGRYRSCVTTARWAKPPGNHGVDCARFGRAAPCRPH